MPLDDLGDLRAGLKGMQKQLERLMPPTGLVGIGITVVEATTRTAYDALVTPNPTTLYAIDESA